MYDLYEEAVKDYDEKLSSLRASLRSLDIPEDEWPSHLQTSRNKVSQPKKSVTLSAFEELERRLKEKQEGHANPLGQ